MKYIEEMIDFIYQSPSSFNACENIAKILLQEDFTELFEKETFNLQAGHKYFVRRNDSSILAFKVPKDLSDLAFNICASHSDAPTFKLKPKNIIKKGNYTVLNTEGYGGMIASSWFDRPLSVAGRVIVETKDSVVSKVVNVEKNLCSICNMPIHINREMNNGYKYNFQKDTLPIIALGEDFDIKTVLANTLKVEADSILTYDLYLYPREKGYVWGANEEFVSSYHLDDLGCAYTSLQAFLASDNANTINTFVCFDNEEVGSLTRQGAASGFMYDNLQRVSKALNVNLENIISKSIMVSADNAHAMHPNYQEKYDGNNNCEMNKGIVIKNNANQSYTSDSLSSAILIKILKKANLNYQMFTNRSDVRGGSTLGNISNSQLSILAVDVGMPQLAMHSANETCGSVDVEQMIKALKAYYNTSIRFDGHKYHLSD